MIKQVYEIDDKGFIVEIYVVSFKDGEIMDEDKISCIAIDPPHGLYKAKWTGAEWIEGATQEEIDEFTKVEPMPPTLEQRIAELENTLLNLLEVL